MAVIATGMARFWKRAKHPIAAEVVEGDDDIGEEEWPARRPVLCVANRDFLVVHRKAPFKEWADSIPEPAWLRILLPPKPGLEPKFDDNIYMVPGEDFPDLAQTLPIHWQEIFEAELNGWCTEPKFWPQNRTWQMFTEWFDVRYMSSMLFDLEDEEIEREVDLE